MYRGGLTIKQANQIQSNIRVHTLIVFAFASIGLTSTLAVGLSFGQRICSYLLKNMILVLISDILFSLQSIRFFTVKVPVDMQNPYRFITSYSP